MITGMHQVSFGKITLYWMDYSAHSKAVCALRRGVIKELGAVKADKKLT